MFTEKDLIQFKNRGIELSEIERQINLFKTDITYVKLSKPATINDGIIKFSDEDIKKFEKNYEEYKQNYDILKFVPASGAATRMFKDLFSFIQDRDLSKYPSVQQVISRIKEFAFYEELKNVIPDEEPYTIANYLLNKQGLNYGNLPKAFIKFHKYEDKARTALEEHLVEGALFAISKNNEVHIHFTLSPEHVNMYNKHVNELIEYYQNKYGITYHLSYSIQDISTDTIAVDMNNQPFREDDGSILFRPAGHGALIYNLNNLNYDLIFIKNIDNVVPDNLKTDTVIYKKALAGFLIYLQKEIYKFQQWADEKSIDENKISEIIEFYKKYFHVNVNIKEFQDVIKLLFRPIRVCGMVKNEGEPGGGPFWVSDNDGNISLQIIESSQINMNDTNQLDIFKSSTHFNPVDLVCSTKNYKGEKYNLLEFVNPETSFISIKTKDGKPLKALELPGLWNGAMAYWNTIFVEVPITTFNPVKTINDLLRPQHLNS